MKYQITVPPDVAREIVAQTIEARFRGDHRPNKTAEAVVAAAETAGFNAVVGLDGVSEVQRKLINGRRKHVVGEFTTKQLRELLGVTIDLNHYPETRFFNYDDYTVVKLKQAINRLQGSIAEIIR